MYYPMFDSTFLIIIPGLLLAMYAQAKVTSTFARYAKISSERRLTGAEVARSILRNEGLEEVKVVMTQGHLTDHYDPRVKTVRLSPEVYEGTSLAAIGVAAHETGHAIQDADGYLPLNIRHTLVPVANFGSNLAFPLFFIGLLLSAPALLKLGIYLFAGVVLFQIVTLPVEYNASKRAMAVLAADGYITKGEIAGTKSVLDAAALTYVAAVLVSLLHLVRLLLLSGILGGRRDD